MLTPQQQDALTRLTAAAVQCEKTTGCPAELTAAQCIFESGWLSVVPGNNCFGIKADAHGAGVQYCLTDEFLNGTWAETSLAFESYATLADCFADHARLIQCGVYAAAWARYQADHNLDAYIAGVAERYATDPAYATKITAEANSSTVQLAVQQARQEALA